MEIPVHTVDDRTCRFHDPLVFESNQLRFIMSIESNRTLNAIKHIGIGQPDLVFPHREQPPTFSAEAHAG